MLTTKRRRGLILRPIFRRLKRIQVSTSEYHEEVDRDVVEEWVANMSPMDEMDETSQANHLKTDTNEQGFSSAAII